MRYDTMKFGRDVGTFWRNVCSPCSHAGNQHSYDRGNVEF